MPPRGELPRLHPEKDSRQLQFDGGDALEQDIAKKFVRWEFSGSFYRDRAFVEQYGRQAERRPFAMEDYNGPTSFHRTFAYGLVPAKGGRLELAVDVGFCYVAKLPLGLLAVGGQLNDRRFERCLYKYGLDWYPVDVSGPARRLYEIEFPHPRTRRLAGVGNDHEAPLRLTSAANCWSSSSMLMRRAGTSWRPISSRSSLAHACWPGCPEIGYRLPISNAGRDHERAATAGTGPNRHAGNTLRD